MTEELSEEQAENIIRQFNEGKANLHSFFTNIIKTHDTTKTGNLSVEELGMSNLPVRTYKELSLFCEDVANQKQFSEYFAKMSEIQTSTSLSKDAILLKLSVTQKKELADVSPPRKHNSGWFKKKSEGEQSGA